MKQFLNCSICKLKLKQRESYLISFTEHSLFGKWKGMYI